MGSSVKSILTIFSLLKAKRKMQLIIIALLMVITSLIEIIAIGSFLPFFAVLTNAENLWEIKYIGFVANVLNIATTNSLFLVVTIAFISLSLMAAVARTTTLYISSRFSAIIGSDISYSAYQNILYRPYIEHIQSETSSSITKVFHQTDKTVMAIQAFLQLLASLLVSTSIILGLLFVDWIVVLLSLVPVAFVYAILGYFSRKQLRKNSYRIEKNVKNIFTSLQDGLKSIRDLILANTRSTYLEDFQKADQPYRILQAQNTFIYGSPKFVVEGLGMVVLASTAFILTLTNNGDSSILPTLGVLALSCQKLIPSLQQIFTNWAQINAYTADCNSIIILLSSKVVKIKNPAGYIPTINFKKLKFENVCFSYPGSKEEILKNVSFELSAGEKVGIIGPSGSGKSTLIDLITGLLTPTSGAIYINDIKFSAQENPELASSWHATLSHVPQSVYIYNATFAENISLMRDFSSNTVQKLRDSANKARLLNYINSLPNGFDSKLGEDGTSLSGGQKQRIAIARAFFRQSSVLVLDEATSALDNITEKEIMHSLYSNNSVQLLIIVAHRLSTLADCTHYLSVRSGAVESISKSNYKSLVNSQEK